MKSKTLLPAVLALALPFLLSLACGTTGPPAIGAVVTATSLDENYKPVGITDTYQPEDTFYVSVQVTDIIIGTTVQVQFKLNGELYEELTLTSDEEGSGYYGFSLRPSDACHTPGTYNAEVYLDGILAKTITFTVQ